MENFKLFPLGDQAVTLSFGNFIDHQHHQKVMAMKYWLEQNRFPGLLDIVVAYSSITVLYDAFALHLNEVSSTSDFVRGHLQKAYQQSENITDHTPVLHRIPVCYKDSFAPDILLLSETKKISEQKIIELHTRPVYNVFMVGFLPGFAYMGEVDQAIAISRKTNPVKVAAGSVGIAGVQTGIYPVSSPGGWQIIGRTPVRLFDKSMNPPVLLEAGHHVQFFAITKEEFSQMNKHV